MSHIFQRHVQKNPVRDYSSVEKNNSANLRMPLGMRTNSKLCCIPLCSSCLCAEKFFQHIDTRFTKLHKVCSGLLPASYLAVAMTCENHKNHTNQINQINQSSDKK